MTYHIKNKPPQYCDIEIGLCIVPFQFLELIEAKNLLISTEKTISEIAYELGYNENSYFSNVFKKKSGQSPSEFRDDMKNMLTS